MPLGCYWPATSSQRLKERIARLGLAVPSRSRRLTAGIALGVLIVGAGCAAWVAKPPQTLAQVYKAARQPAIPPRSDDTIYLRGKVEKIDFGDTSYTVYVRASSIAGSEAAPAQFNAALWELSPLHYWGDRDAVTRTLMNAFVTARGSSAANACTTRCRLFNSDLAVPKDTALPTPSGDFGLTDLAMSYDTGRAVVVRGVVERIEFSKRTFDAYVRAEPNGPISGSLFQVRSEYRFGRADIQRRLLKQVVSVAGWRAKGSETSADHEMWPGGPIEPACETVCGLYGADFELPGKVRLTPAGAQLVSSPAIYDPDSIPAVPAGYAGVADIADKNAPLTLSGRITKLDDSTSNTVFFVEAARLAANSTSRAGAGTIWRVVALKGLSDFGIDATVTVRGFAAKDKSCQPTCLMSATELQGSGTR